MGCMCRDWWVHFSILACRASSQVLLNCPRATEWRLCMRLLLEHVALFLGFLHVQLLFWLCCSLVVFKQPRLACAQPHCPWLYPLKTEVLPCGLQSGYMLTSSYDKCTLSCQTFSLSSLSKWNGLRHILIPDEAICTVGLETTDSSWGKKSPLKPNDGEFWLQLARLPFLSAALADNQTASFSIL